MQNKLTSIIISLLYNDLEPFKYETRIVINEITFCSFLFGILFGFLLIGLPVLIIINSH
jgi:hypothetical protein